MAALEADSTYDLTVLRVQQNADTFPATSAESPDGLMHCHFIDVNDGYGNIYNLQVCNVNDFYNDCAPGDIVRVVIKKFTKQKYTLVSLQAISVKPLVPENDYEMLNKLQSLKKPVPPVSAGLPLASVSVPLKRTSNPPMAGTAAAIALQAAVQYCTNDIGEDFKKEYPDIKDTFELFFKLLTSKI